MSAAQKVEQVLSDLIADHPMWIDANGEGLDYLPEREARIADFVREAAEQVIAAIGEPTVEYGVRWPIAYSGGDYDVEECPNRKHAEALIRLHGAWDGTLVTRTVLTGEWQEADRG